MGRDSRAAKAAAAAKREGKTRARTAPPPRPLLELVILEVLPRQDDVAVDDAALSRFRQSVRAHLSVLNAPGLTWLAGDTFATATTVDQLEDAGVAPVDQTLIVEVSRGLNHGTVGRFDLISFQGFVDVKGAGVRSPSADAIRQSLAPAWPQAYAVQLSVCGAGQATSAFGRQGQFGLEWTAKEGWRK